MLLLGVLEDAALANRRCNAHFIQQIGFVMRAALTTPTHDAVAGLSHRAGEAVTAPGGLADGGFFRASIESSVRRRVTTVAAARHLKPRGVDCLPTRHSRAVRCALRLPVSTDLNCARWARTDGLISSRPGSRPAATSSVRWSLLSRLRCNPVSCLALPMALAQFR